MHDRIVPVACRSTPRWLIAVYALAGLGAAALGVRQGIADADAAPAAAARRRAAAVTAPMPAAAASQPDAVSVRDDAAPVDP